MALLINTCSDACGCLSDYSNIAYCVQVEKVNPWSTHYHGVYASYGDDEWTSGSVNGAATFQAAMACGPGGALYQESLLWWKNYLRDHSSVISGYTYEYGRDVSLSNGTNSNGCKGYSLRYIKLYTRENNKRAKMILNSRQCVPWTNSKSEDALNYCVCGFEFCQNQYESTTMVRQISRISPESKFSNLRFRYIP